MPIFVASPKLFTLMQDVDVASVTKTIEGKQVAVRQININRNLIELVRLGDVADIKQGLATGDNRTYIYKNQMLAVTIVKLALTSSIYLQKKNSWKLQRMKSGGSR